MSRYGGGYDCLVSLGDEIAKHIGKWIIIYDDKIFAADKDLGKIYKKFESENPGEIPFVMKFPKERNMVL